MGVAVTVATSVMATKREAVKGGRGAGTECERAAPCPLGRLLH